MKKLTIAIAATLITLPSLAMAGGKHHSQSTVVYQGPTELTALSELLQDTSMFTEKDVVVEGKLVRQINGDTYIFSDGEKEIQVELDDDIHLSQPIDDKTNVRLYGEYEGGSTPEIEVEHIQVL